MIVLLASKGGVRSAVAFTLGWFTAILGLGAVIVFGVTSADAEHTSSVTWLQIGIQLGFGLALLLYAYGRWTKRPPRGHTAAEPGWIRKLDRIRPLLAFVFGAIWINGFLVVPAALEISRADATGPQKAFALPFYAVGASAGLIAVIAYRLLAPGRATERLGRLRGWVGRNSTVTIAILLAAIGGGLVLKALVGAVRLW